MPSTSRNITIEGRAELGLISPEIVRPYPKALPRIKSRRGRKKGKCSVITDTPEKDELLEADAQKNKKVGKASEKRKQKTVLKVNKAPKKKRVKKAMVSVPSIFNCNVLVNRPTSFEPADTTDPFEGDSSSTEYIPSTTDDSTSASSECFSRIHVIVAHFEENNNLDVDVPNVSDLQSNADTRESKDWLVNNTEPWSEVLEHWKKTYTIRINREYKYIAEFVSEWPILKLNESQCLIEDFNRMYTNGGTLLLNWSRFFDKVKNLEVHQDKYFVQDLMTSLELEIQEDSKHAIQIYLLPSFFPPTSRIRCKSKHWKPSTAECRESFIIHAKAAGEIHLNIERRKEKL
ncbi:hypothetical protein QE152_g40139 [Popillia japonica]|uniref:Uncharacterized protein n=1 Tax=Popillia japonica TaxID=7064 RepID=A0AAW1HRY5_POPJA